MNIHITNFQHKTFVPIAKVRSAAQLTCRKLKFKFFELSIVFVGEKRMRNLNRKYLDHDHVTDVITFTEGEIVICPAVAKRNAKRHGNSIEREMVLYVVHGILHLCGYDDHKPADVKRMRQKEQQIMDLLR